MRLTALPSRVDGGEVDRPAAARIGADGGGARPIAGRCAAASSAAWPGRAARSTGTSWNSGSVRWRRGRPSRASPPRSRGGSSAASVTPSGPNAAGGGGSNGLEDVEQLEGDDAGAVRRMGRDPDAAIVDRDRLASRSSVWAARSSAVIAEPAAARPRACRSRELAVVEVVEAVVGEALERRGQRRQADALAGPPRPAVRPVDRWNPASGPSAARPVGAVALDGGDEAVPGREAVRERARWPARGRRPATARP